MSTPCLIYASGGMEGVTIYQHHDGHPETVLAYLAIVLKEGLCWSGDRWSPAEFLAAYVGKHKGGPGGIYLTQSTEDPYIVDYTYTVYQHESGNHLTVAWGNEFASITWEGEIIKRWGPKA